MKSHKNILLYILFCILSLSITPIAEARWAKHEDADKEYEFFNRDIVINKDGSYEENIELRGKVLKEYARDYFTHYRLNYNDDASQIHILEAKTIHNGKEYIVTPGMIEDKPLASLGHGFDQIKQLAIFFPNIEIGSEIYLKYKRTEYKVPIKNFYGRVIGYPGSYVKTSNTKIRSQLPLNIKVNDPRDVLKVTSNRKVANNSVHEINITLKSPIFDNVVNEKKMINDKHLTWVSISSLSNWKDFAKEVAPAYYDVINQELPEMFMSIAQEVNDQDSDEDKINLITSKLNERIQYMGDWRTVEGCYFPRDLQKIVDSQVGDCKDFSAATAAILHRLGYKVQPLWVLRGKALNLNKISTLPVLFEFNHAMLKVTNKNGTVYWIDPTNLVSMAQGMFPDISDRDVLVLDYKRAGLERTPKVEHKRSKYTKNSELIIQGDLLKQQGTITLQGETALDIAGLGLYYSNERLKEIAFRDISGIYLTDDERKFLELPDLTSRIVKDLTIKFEFEKKNHATFKTNLGDAFTLEVGEWLDKVIDTAPDQISDVFIGTPETIEIYSTIKDVNIKNCNLLNFEEHSPWLYVSRSCRYHNDSTEFVDTVSILKSFITNEELQSEEYKNLKNKLERDFRRATIIIN